MSQDFTYGEYIKRERKKRNWSLKLLAAKLDVSLTYLADVENNRRYAFPEEKLLLLAEIFGITSNIKEYNLYLDLAAETRNTVPLDVEKFMLKNRELILFIRKLANKQFISEEYVSEILKNIKF
ncbi:helix-turn-helix family protein [Clostridium argentinense CDC 2741]|uniref:Helix-turn-helix family protein n=2 Tax=Clostridium argentinense TaxID=29341 RepID=A0A0C1QUN2_9CLOT|nr:helix-turn-helix transcriptional regulator [Clostridium argentinense]ARC83143.1 transcriptional regulator [Clostridium argentinense]KIE44752.1 helix-turn-helix family protein [Clostridium argentinense CDC 2741]NFF41616.1 helix-turn-helix transcriptional regulator [Clostridium argentinense]NFP52316.1 helix-turn-helix transcriptional regulator [Clostridium argentinense]NFP74671.1 helix-turn-helix transcriptional regulator [Clostridium argentinense]